MIETVCKISATEIEYFEYECKRCKNIVRYKAEIDMLHGCRMCGEMFEDADREYLETVKKLQRLQRTDTSKFKFGFTFVSVEK